MSGMPASPRNSAYSDQPQAESTPSEISVSIVAAPCLRFAHAARWNGHAPHRITGVASCRLSHCQLSNCSGPIIAIASSGADSSAEMIRRRRSGASGSVSGASSGSSSGSVAS